MGWCGAARAGEPLDFVTLGDSLSTGAATNAALTFDAEDLWKVFTGATNVGVDRPAPRRLWPSTREFRGSADWVFRHLIQSLSRKYLDTEELSWGYLVGERLGIPASHIAIAGEDGARTDDAVRHVDRVLDANGGLLPRRLFLFYTGNDLCAPTVSLTTPPEEFQEALQRGLSYIARNGGLSGEGSDVYVVGYLSVLQLLHSDEILAKKVKAFGEEITCRALREQLYQPKDPAYLPKLPPEAWYFPRFMPPNPAEFCPTLFGLQALPGAKKDEIIGALANRIRDYRKIQVEAVQAAQVVAPANLRFHYIAETTNLTFGADDIAGDCFHLSAAGQQKIASAVYGRISVSRAD